MPDERSTQHPNEGFDADVLEGAPKVQRPRGEQDERELPGAADVLEGEPKVPRPKQSSRSPKQWFEVLRRRLTRTR